MSVGPEIPKGDPWQWCWQCGQPLWDWSTVWETTTFVGRVALCRVCGKDLSDKRPVINRAGLLGWYDKDTWQRAKGKGKS
jgi:hypothetical protein